MTVLSGIDRRLLQNVDWPLLGAMGGLVILSATTLASLHIGRAGGNVAFRQLAWFALGLCALVLVASIDYRRLVRWAQPVGKATLALTVPVLVVPALLIVKQPDLGTALLLLPVMTALLVGAGI